MTSVVIIGAGPYGLSLASHLRAARIDFRIFGRPMSSWQEHMPAGMLLKSDGCASNLYDPEGTFTLRDFCRQQAIPYDDRVLPVALDTFVAYGLAFAKRFVPELEQREVAKVERCPGGGFLVHHAGGESVFAQRVVVAVGITHFRHVPPVLAALPPGRLSHTCDHTDLSRFAGRDVIVVGAGASALDAAALLHRSGSFVQLVSRRTAIDFLAPPGPEPTSIDRLVRPPTGIGPGWRNMFYAELPLAFHWLPEDSRRAQVGRHLGPAPGWFSREQTEGRVPFLLGATPLEAAERHRRVHLRVAMQDGSSRTLQADHVIAGTGYKVDLRRIPFLGSDLLAGIDAVDGTPRLSSHFECSVPGLFFTGVASANSFGPVMRFAFGAKFATPRLARHLVRTGPPKPALPGHRTATPA